MSVDINSLISCYQSGLTYNIAKDFFENNIKRYDRLGANLHAPDRAGFVPFNAFTIDYILSRLKVLTLYPIIVEDFIEKAQAA